jgi:hypothetical protein
MSEFGYAEPPEGLEKEVRDSINLRLKNPGFAGAFDVELGSTVRADSTIALPFFALATQQPVSLEKVYALRSPSSWGFIIELEPEARAPLLAAAGLGSGGGFRYSSILALPEEIQSDRSLTEILSRASVRGFDLTYLQVPSYYLEAFWFRTGHPEEDHLAFLKNTFGRFPIWSPLNPQFVPLSTFVEYLNDRLKKGEAAKTDYQDGKAD